MSDYNVLKRIEHHTDSNGNYYGGLDEADIQEIEEMQIKSKAFDEIDRYLTEAYNKYHDMKNTTLRNKLISSHISKNVTLLFQRIGDKYGYKE